MLGAIQWWRIEIMNNDIISMTVNNRKKKNKINKKRNRWQRRDDGHSKHLSSCRRPSTRRCLVGFVVYSRRVLNPEWNRADPCDRPQSCHTSQRVGERWGTTVGARSLGWSHQTRTGTHTCSHRNIVDSARAHTDGRQFAFCACSMSFAVAAAAHKRTAVPHPNNH